MSQLLLTCTYDAVFITNVELAASVAPLIQVIYAFRTV